MTEPLCTHARTDGTRHQQPLRAAYRRRESTEEEAENALSGIVNIGEGSQTSLRCLCFLLPGVFCCLQLAAFPGMCRDAVVAQLEESGVGRRGARWLLPVITVRSSTL